MAASFFSLLSCFFQFHFSGICVIIAIRQLFLCLQRSISMSFFFQHLKTIHHHRKLVRKHCFRLGPLVAHRSARNLFKPSLFSGVNQKNSPVDCFFERGSFLQKTPPTRSFRMPFLCALGHKHTLPLARSAKAANHQRGSRA